MCRRIAVPTSAPSTTAGWRCASSSANTDHHGVTSRMPPALPRTRLQAADIRCPDIPALPIQPGIALSASLTPRARIPGRPGVFFFCKVQSLTRCTPARSLSHDVPLSFHPHTTTDWPPAFPASCSSSSAPACTSSGTRTRSTGSKSLSWSRSRARPNRSPPLCSTSPPRLSTRS